MSPRSTGILDITGRLPGPSIVPVERAARPGLVGHRALSLARHAGTPTTALLAEARHAGLSAVEIDVCVTAADGRKPASVVVRHDLTVTASNVDRSDLLSSGRASRRRSHRRQERLHLPLGAPVSALTLHELRRLDPGVLELDEALDILDGVPVLVDIKSDATAPRLGTVLRQRRGSSIAVCTESVAALHELRRRAPQIMRWPSFPDLGVRHHDHVRRVVSDLVRSQGRELFTRGAVEVAGAVAQLRHRPDEGIARLAGLPWRRELPAAVRRVAASIGAAGVCVQHWLVTPELCSTAHEVGLSVCAWTVNDTRAAARVAGCGVDLITTDDPDTVRAAL